jgi:hypothetical protein
MNIQPIVEGELAAGVGITLEQWPPSDWVSP